MNPRRVSLFLVALVLAVGGCRTQPPSHTVDAEFTLETAMFEGRMVFMGVGGEIDGLVNPDLNVDAGDTVRVVLVNDDGIPHDFAVPDLDAQTSLVMAKGQTAEAVFQAGKPGEFDYYCAVAGHRQMGMEGELIVHEP
ncbi:MAG: hypothetical protein C4557_12500 [Anaerolineaceae bacterium]|jgi:nitrite reductase (NO-forming)|nr:MAG: hypothetical protein C4557_12500 [Anaerolineaceae bacterium]